MPLCRECGKTVGAGDRFCEHCGAKLGGDSGQAGTQAPLAEREDARADREPTETDRGDDPWNPDAETRRDANRGPPGSPATQQSTGHQSGARQPAEVDDPDPELPHDDKDGVEFAFSYPLSVGWTPALIGGLLLVFSWLIVPLLALIGYGYRVARAAALGHEEPPGYEDWGGLIIDGARFSVVMLVTGVLLALPFVAFSVLSQLSELFALLVFPLVFVAGYVAFAFPAVFLGTDSIETPFTTDRVVDLVTTTYYLKAFGFALVIRIALNFIAFFSLITLIGWIWVYAFTIPVYGAFWGYIYHRAAKQGILPPAEGSVGDDEPFHGDRQTDGQEQAW